MASSKGVQSPKSQEGKHGKSRGYSAKGKAGHGGHHRKRTTSVPMPSKKNPHTKGGKKK